MKKLNKKENVAIFALSILLILSLFSISGVINFASIYDSGSGETLYQEIVIDNVGQPAITNSQIEIDLIYNPHMQTDFDDIQFYDSEGTLLKHDKHSYVNSVRGKFFIKTSVDADSTKTIYVYFGNPDTTDLSDPANVYDYYITGEASQWSGTYDYLGADYIQISNAQTMATATTFTTNHVLDFEMRRTDSLSDDNSNAWAGFGTTKDTSINVDMYDTSPNTIRFRTLVNSVATEHEVENFVQNEWKYVSLAYLDGSAIYDDGVTTDTITTNVPTGNQPIFIEGRSDKTQTMQVRNIVIRDYNANPPTISFGSFYNEAGQEIIPYDINPDVDLVIPISIDASATKSYYLSKPTGYSSNPKEVYDFYEDFDSGVIDRIVWDKIDSPTIVDGKLIIDNDNEQIFSRESFGMGYTLETYAKCTNLLGGVMFAWLDVDGDTGGLMFREGDGGANFPRYRLINGGTDVSYDKSSWDAINTFATYKITRPSSSEVIFTQNANSESYTTVANIPTEDLQIKFDVWAGGTRSCDWIKIYQYTMNEPTVSITDMGSYYKFDIINNELTPLSGYQVVIDGTEFSLSGITDSLMITETCPITLTSEETDTSSTTVDSNVVLSVIFSDTVQDAKATITKPDTSSETVVLSNSEGNTWTATLNYPAIGIYTIDNFKINSESETIDSALTFDLTSPPPELSEESLTETNVTTGTSTTLSATITGTISDVKATITLPDTSSELVILSNSEGDIWTKELTYTEIGNYTIENYKINSETETIISSLSYQIIETESTSPSSSGGGGSSTITIETAVEENTPEIVNIQKDSNQVIDFKIFNADIMTIIMLTLIGILFVMVWFKGRKN